MHKKAPLPFIGQKRNFINHYLKVLNEHIPADGEGWTIVDAFGGSGLLSHVSKSAKPKATVIYNDYDGYSERLRHIDDINRLRHQLADILINAPRGKKITSDIRAKVFACLHTFDGYIDMPSLSTWLLFSGGYANSLDELDKKPLYNTIRRSDYPFADDYLTGLNVVKMDFETLLKPPLNNNRCLLVLDPPYICTTQGMYANNAYFGMVEFLRLMRLVRPPFIFFSSTRSELIGYVDFVIKYKMGAYENFKGYRKVAIEAKPNGTTGYEDNMIFKW